MAPLLVRLNPGSVHIVEINERLVKRRITCGHGDYPPSQNFLIELLTVNVIGFGDRSEEQAQILRYDF